MLVIQVLTKEANCIGLSGVEPRTRKKKEETEELIKMAEIDKHGADMTFAELVFSHRGSEVSIFLAAWPLHAGWKQLRQSSSKLADSVQLLCGPCSVAGRGDVLVSEAKGWWICAFYQQGLGTPSFLRWNHRIPPPSCQGCDSSLSHIDMKLLRRKLEQSGQEMKIRTKGEGKELIFSITWIG